MLDRSDVVLASLTGVSLTLTPMRDAQGTLHCRASFTATLTSKDWCTSPTYNQGLGQVLQVYFETSGHALVLPWTMGAFKIEALGSSQNLNYEKDLDPKVFENSTEVQLVIQPCLWKKCP